VILKKLEIVLFFFSFFNFFYIDTILGKLGKGGFGFVCLCIGTVYQNLFALKCLKSSDITSEKEKQFGYMSRLNSKYLMKYLETFRFEDNFCVVMKYYENGSLDKFIKSHVEKHKNIPELVYFIIFIFEI
jgi:serine/threonine protein kinase